MKPSKGALPTIASLLTPPGTGAVAVIRLAGPQSLKILRQIFGPAGRSQAPPDPERIVFGRLHDQWGAIDDGLVVATRTEEQWQVEINTHGSWRVLQRLMTRLRELGAESPGAGEEAGADDDRVSVAAGAGGGALRDDLWAALARCRTRRAVRWATTAAAGLEDWLDQLPERRGPGDREALRAECQAMLAGYQVNRVLIEGVRVALLGPPNAGKSTLANRLYARQASLESPVPGTTRDWVEEPAILGGVPVHVLDTAGLADGERRLDKEAMRRGLLRSEQADFRWLVVDIRAELPARARDWLAGRSGDAKAFLVLNKVDLSGPTEPGWLLPRQWASRTVRISALTGEGLEGLEELFLDRLGLGPIRAGEAGLICHRQAEKVGWALARWESGDGAEVMARLLADLRAPAGIG